MRRGSTLVAAFSVLIASGTLCARQEVAPGASEPTPAPAPVVAPVVAPADAAADPAAKPLGAENKPLENEITPELDEAVTRGLKVLAEEQDADGSFGQGRSAYGKSVAITALACIAFMADGNLPGRGAYGVNVERGLEFILSSMNDTGLIADDTSHGPMYGHGFATLFLGEVYGMTRGGADTALSARLHEALLKSTRLIIETQNDEGGWRYNPVPYDADLSVTICQIMALRSARNAGIDIPKETIDRAVEYVRKSQNDDGGFRYQLTSRGSLWPRSAAGIASLYYAGEYEDQGIERALNYLERTAMPNTGKGVSSHYFYGHYYAVQATYLAGGDWWARWWPAIRAELLASQNADGTWSDQQVGPVYGTSMALIVLQMPKRYLPIFQK